MFIGREKELQKLENISSRKRPSIVVIKGRRRVGKSRLAKEFGKNRRFLEFSGLAPMPQTTAQMQRDTFAKQFCEQFKLAPLTFNDWMDAFLHLLNQLTNEPTVILFDEISWMGSLDPLFVAKIKDWWDRFLQDYPHLTLIFCGSVSLWIEKNIINSTALFGRISLTITLEELSLQESVTFLKKLGFKGSDYELFKICSIFGGIPWYLEHIYPNETAEENIKRLCFEKGGALFEEFDRIFNDLFDSKSQIYKKIIFALAQGKKTQADLREALNYARSGSFKDYLDALTISGFIAQHPLWSFDQKTPKKQIYYRLSDSYIRFYVKYVASKVSESSSLITDNINLNDALAWESILGLQVENLLLNNRKAIIHGIGINPNDIIGEGPYIQKQTQAMPGCQIDYLIQTKSQNLYICEFKFNRREISKEVIDDMKAKIHKLKVPKGMGVCPILVHFGDIHASVCEENYFYRILNMRDFALLT